MYCDPANRNILPLIDTFLILLSLRFNLRHRRKQSIQDLEVDPSTLRRDIHAATSNRRISERTLKRHNAFHCSTVNRWVIGGY